MPRLLFIVPDDCTLTETEDGLAFSVDVVCCEIRDDEKMPLSHKAAEKFLRKDAPPKAKNVLDRVREGGVAGKCHALARDLATDPELADYIAERRLMVIPANKTITVRDVAPMEPA